jgi:hypothetical protein
VNAHDRVIRLGALAAAGLALAGCGGTGSSASRTPTATSQGAGTGSAPATGAAAGTTTSTSSGAAAGRSRHRSRVVHGPPVGARQGVHIGGTYLTVTILRVLRLTHTGSHALAGTRQVGLALRIADQHGATYDSTASGDVSLVLSAGRSEPLDVRRGPCQTPLVDFESIVSAGSVRTGCVAFSVPRRARVVGVRFSPHSRSRGALTWRAG